MYLEEELKAAIQSAREVINSRAISAERYIWGYNDCFSFVLEYERALRGSNSLSKDITLTYSGSEDFLVQVKEQLGYSNLLEFALSMKFNPVSNRIPKTGDVAFDSGTMMLADKNYWFTTDERNKGVKPRRKFLFKEIKINLHVRPVYLGE
jgi:hypothetical protein